MEISPLKTGVLIHSSVNLVRKCLLLSKFPFCNMMHESSDLLLGTCIISNLTEENFISYFLDHTVVNIIPLDIDEIKNIWDN